MKRALIAVGVVLQAAGAISLTENNNGGNQKNVVIGTGNVDGQQQTNEMGGTNNRGNGGPSSGPSPTWTDEKVMQGHQEFRGMGSEGDMMRRHRGQQDNQQQHNHHGDQQQYQNQRHNQDRHREGRFGYDGYRFLSEVEGGDDDFAGVPLDIVYGFMSADELPMQRYFNGYEGPYRSGRYPMVGASAAYGGDWEVGPTGGYYERDMITATNRMTGGGNMMGNELMTTGGSYHHGADMMRTGGRGAAMGMMGRTHEAPLRRLDSWREEEEMRRRRRQEMEMGEFGRFGAAGSNGMMGRPLGAGFDRDRRGERWDREGGFRDGGFREGGYYQGGNRYGNENRYRSGGIGGGLSNLVNEIF